MKPFDAEKAKQGHPICTSRRDVIYIAGPDVRGYVAAECDKELTLLPVETLRMKPLCIVEGKDVYPGDVLYWLDHRFEVLSGGANGFLTCGPDQRGIPGVYRSSDLSWSPKPKKEVVSLWIRDNGDLVCNAMKAPFAARRLRAIEITPEGDVVCEVPE